MAQTVKVDDAQVIDMLNRLQAKSVNMINPMREISGYLHTFTKLVFDTEGQKLHGKRWKDLSPITKANKVERGTWPRTILTDSFQLEQSIQPFYSATEAGVGTNKVYAEVHQFGGVNPVNVKSHSRTSKKGKVYTVKAYTMHRKIPARPFFGFNGETNKAILNILCKYLCE